MFGKSVTPKDFGKISSPIVDTPRNDLDEGVNLEWPEFQCVIPPRVQRWSESRPSSEKAISGIALLICSGGQLAHHVRGPSARHEDVSAIRDDYQVANTDHRDSRAVAFHEYIAAINKLDRATD